MLVAAEEKRRKMQEMQQQREAEAEAVGYRTLLCIVLEVAWLIFSFHRGLE